MRVIGGIRETDFSDPLLGLWIEFVSFPMTLTNHKVESPGDPEEITVHNEDELKSWADVAFEPDAYELWDLQIPLGAILASTFQPGYLFDPLARFPGWLLARVTRRLVVRALR